MREQIEKRLEELKGDFETGQARLQELEMQTSRLRETLLRISGAIQVLQETLGPEAGGEGEQGAPPARASSAS